MKSSQNYIKEQWKRYLDDCFIFWERSMTDFAYFENVLNSLHADMQFKIIIWKAQGVPQ